jgi:hypothetical protein
MSWRQDNIFVNDWNSFNEDPKHPYVSNLQNDLEHIRQSQHVPFATAQAKQSNYASFDQALGLDQTSASSVVRNFLYGKDAPGDPSMTTWPSQLDIPLEFFSSLRSGPYSSLQPFTGNLVN